MTVGTVRAVMPENACCSHDETGSMNSSVSMSATSSSSTSGKSSRIGGTSRKKVAGIEAWPGCSNSR